jgi:hypothetical protein
LPNTVLQNFHQLLFPIIVDLEARFSPREALKSGTRALVPRTRLDTRFSSAGSYSARRICAKYGLAESPPSAKAWMVFTASFRNPTCPCDLRSDPCADWQLARTRRIAEARNCINHQQNNRFSRIRI